MRVRIFVFVLLLAGCAALAQTPSAGVVGRITDATGGVIPGVTIKITNLDTNISQAGISNDTGDYTVPYLNPGRYSLEAANPGFRTYRREEFSLLVDQTLSCGFSTFPAVMVTRAAGSVSSADSPGIHSRISYLVGRTASAVSSTLRAPTTWSRTMPAMLRTISRLRPA